MTTTVEIQTQHKRIDFVVLATEEDEGVKAHIRNVVAHGVEYSSGHHHQVLFTTRMGESKDMYDALESVGLLDAMSEAIARDGTDRDDLTNLKHVSLNALRQQLRRANRENVKLKRELKYANEQIETLLGYMKAYETAP